VGLDYKDWGIVYTVFKPVRQLIRFILGQVKSTSCGIRRNGSAVSSPLIFPNRGGGTVAQHEKITRPFCQNDTSHIFMSKEDTLLWRDTVSPDVICARTGTESWVEHTNRGFFKRGDCLLYMRFVFVKYYYPKAQGPMHKFSDGTLGGSEIRGAYTSYGTFYCYELPLSYYFFGLFISSRLKCRHYGSWVWVTSKVTPCYDAAKGD
jgi:hypothetical protein